MNYFEARWYDPALGRWHSPYPLEQFHSPYVGMANDPANFIDPDGRNAREWLKSNWEEVGIIACQIGMSAWCIAGCPGLGAIGSLSPVVTGIVGTGLNVAAAGGTIAQLSHFTKVNGASAATSQNSMGLGSAMPTSNSQSSGMNNFTEEGAGPCYPRFHKTNASIYITHFEVYVGGELVNDYPSDEENDEDTFVTGTEITQGNLAYPGVSEVTVRANIIPSRGRESFDVIVNPKYYEISVSSSEPGATQQSGLLTDKLSPNYVQMEFETWRTNDGSVADFTQASQSKVVAFQFVFQTSGSFQTDERKALTAKYHELSKKIHSLYGPQVDMQIRFVENAAQTRVQINTTRQIFSIPKSSEYYNLYQNALPNPCP